LSPIFSHLKNWKKIIPVMLLLGLAWESNKIMNVKALRKLWRVIQYTWKGSLLLLHLGRWEREEEHVNVLISATCSSFCLQSYTLCPPTQLPPPHTHHLLCLYRETFNPWRLKQITLGCSHILDYKKDRSLKC
jgi:hypothetical protein